MAGDIFALAANIDDELNAAPGGLCVDEPDAAAHAAGMGMMSSHSNVFGGVDVYDNGHFVLSTQPNVFGGFDAHEPVSAG